MTRTYNSTRFRHTVHYVDTPEDIEEIASGLRSSPVLGFDCEMLDSRVRGTLTPIQALAQGRRPVLLISLATKSDVYLFHLYSCKDVPVSLRKLLSSETVTKIGFATHNDVNALAGMGVRVSNVLDLKALCSSLCLSVRSLSDVASDFTPYLLTKGYGYDWTTTLSPLGRSVRWEEVEYAALDAIVCLEAHAMILGSVVKRVHLDGTARQCISTQSRAA